MASRVQSSTVEKSLPREPAGRSPLTQEIPKYMGKKVLLMFACALILPSLAFSQKYGTSGTVTITGDADNGAPNSILFTGAVTQFPQWVKTTLPDGTDTYTFTGRAAGTMSDGSSRTIVVRFRVNKGENIIFPAAIPLPRSRSPISMPEPSSVALIGTSFAGLVGAIWRKKKQNVCSNNQCCIHEKRPC